VVFPNNKRALKNGVVGDVKKRIRGGGRADWALPAGGGGGTWGRRKGGGRRGGERGSSGRARMGKHRLIRLLNATWEEYR